MDLSKFNITKQAELGANLELLDPNDEPLFYKDGKKKKVPVTIKLLGMDSKVWRNKNRDVQRERIAKMTRKKSKNVDHTVSDEDACDMLALCTIGWDGIDEDGKPLEFSYDAAYKMYMSQIWIREQADTFIADRANFFTSA